MKRLIAAAGLALAAASTAACGGAHTSSPTTVTVTVSPPAQASGESVATPPVAQPPVELGQWITDGSLSFNVCASFTGGNEDGTNHLTVWMRVENVGGVPQTYSTRLQRLTDDQGRVFAPAYGLRPGDQPTWDRISDVDLNPGVAIRAAAAFTVPKNVSADHYQAELHGSPSSPGAVVRLQENGLPDCV